MSVTTTDATQANQEPTTTRRSRRISRQDIPHRAASILLLIAFLGIWQFASGRLIRPVWVSSPERVWDRLVRDLGDGSLVRHVFATFQETILGLAIGVVLGVVVGILLANAKGTARVVDPYLVGAYSLPRVALAPFFVLWFGIGLESKVLLVVSIAFFPVLFNVRQGMGSIDRDLTDVYRSMRAGRWPMLRDVVIPTVLPWVVSSIKIAIGMALIGAVVGEMVGADRGLGWLVTQSINNFDMTGAMMSLLLMAVIATVLTSLVSVVERWLFRWRSDSGRSSIVPM